MESRLRDQRMPKSLRIFISSPGDVVPERRRAQLVIDKLAKTYARFFSIEPIMWEAEPMLAAGHFQDQIIPPSETDIVVFIVWSRLGTPMPEKTETREYRGIDGRVPVTGSEWEFEDALAAQKKRGTPDVLAYRKEADPIVSLKNAVTLAAAKDQWDRLNDFWNRWFTNRDQLQAAFSTFIDLDGFEAKLENDLRKLIERRIEALRAMGRNAPVPIWHESPFRGLDVYRFEHAPIFFGRSAMTKAAVEQLTSNAENTENCRSFLLILGASGAGKSSLAQAGVLPALTWRGIVPEVGVWRRALMHPGSHSDGPFAALAQSLVAETALPELLAPKQSITELGHHLKAAANDPSFPIVGALSQVEQSARTHGKLLKIETARLVLVVDQLEELFTASELTADDRNAFIRSLDGLARCGRVSVLATMRSDYWHRAAETPLLVDMAAGNGRLDLLPPGQDDVFEMIRQAAQAAGIEFETDPIRGTKLDATLAMDAAREPGALPLLSFLLDELYKEDIQTDGGSTLTYNSMRKLGPLEGAIAKRANLVLDALSAEVQAAIPKVLWELVTISSADAEPTTQVAPMTRFPEGSPEGKIVNVLLDPQVRLLVAEGDGEGARVRLAHEALITHWEKAKRLIARHRDDYRTRTNVKEALAEYNAVTEKNRPSYLLRDPQLANALDLANRESSAFEPRQLSFIAASRRKARLVQQLTRAAVAVFATVAFAASLLGLIAYRSQQKAEQNLIHAEIAQSRFLAGLASQYAFLGDARTATLLALESLEDARTGKLRHHGLDAEAALLAARHGLQETIIIEKHVDMGNVWFCPDGARLITATGKLLMLGSGPVFTWSSCRMPSCDYTAHIWDATNGREIMILKGHDREIITAKFSANGTRIVTASFDKTAGIWDAANGRELVILKGHEDAVSSADLSPDGARVVTASFDSGWGKALRSQGT
jgi:hypothetical protein